MLSYVVPLLPPTSIVCIYFVTLIYTLKYLKTLLNCIYTVLVYILKDKHSSKTLPLKSYVLSSFCKVKALVMRVRPHKTPIIHNSGKNMQTEISVALKNLPFMNFYRVFVGSCNSAFIPIQFWYSQLPLTNVLGLNSLVKILQIMSRPKY